MGVFNSSKRRLFPQNSLPAQGTTLQNLSPVTVQQDIQISHNPQEDIDVSPSISGLLAKRVVVHREIPF